MRFLLAAVGAGALAAAALSTSGCLQLDTGDDGGTTGTGTTTTPSSSTSADVSAGANCGPDPTGSVVLCEEIALCPNLGVDPTAYAGCGFRLGSASPIDLECVCSGWLCPIGVANSCSDATQLLSSQDALTVCEQVNEGRCLQLSASTDASTSGSSGTCTQACRDECANAPDCLVACGC